MTKTTYFFIIVAVLFLMCAVLSRSIFSLEFLKIAVKPSSFLIAANISLTLAVLFKK